MRFADIPTRGYGVTDPSWWNSLRDAGIALEGAQFNFTLTNGQATPAAITNLAIDSSISTSARVEIEIRQKTNSNEIVCRGVLNVFWRAASLAWDFVPPEWIGDDPGITLSISTTGSVGQMSYTLATLSGTGYSGTFKFKPFAMGA